MSISTIGTLLKRPTQFFADLKPETLGTKTIFLGIGCLFLGIICTCLASIYLISLISNMKSLEHLVPLKQIELLKKEALLSLLFSPATAFFGIYLFASALHFLIKGFCHAPRIPLRYETTLYLVCLCQVPMLFSFIPIIGPPIASVWTFVLMLKAFKQIYGLSALMALMCMLPPALFLKLTWGSALQMLALSL